jgi:hypothetical protein
LIRQEQLAAAGLPDDHEIDPVCGMGVDPLKTEKKSEYRRRDLPLLLEAM